ncbi:MAG: glycosyl hydrolase family 88, partial [Bacteroidetes bacterium]
LYDQTKDERYEKVMFTLRKQLEWQPRTTDDGFWHKLRYTYQMWLDGLYMGAPYYAQFAQRYNEPDAFDDIAHQLILMENHTRDEKTGLLYHGWDESRVQTWSNPETGKSPEFWGRAMGWYAMALVDVLDYFPDDHSQRQEIIDILNRLAEAVTKVQDENTGLWFQVLDKGGQQGNYLEATVSSMFSYALIKGVNNGYLPLEYKAVARKAYDGIIENLIEVEPSGEVHIHKCCAVAGLGGNPYRDGSYEYYINEEVRSNDTKATGPFIMASLEFERKIEKIQ